MSKPTRIRRFPRLVEGKEFATLAKLLWQKPRLSVKVTPDRRAVLFRFRVPVSPKIRRMYPAVWSILFDDNTDLEKALSEAYKNAKWGDKKLHHHFSTMLGVVYTDAMAICLDRAWTLHDIDGLQPEEVKNFYATKAEEVKKFQEVSSRPRRLQPNPRRAIWLWERYMQLRPAIKELRTLISKKAKLPDSVLAKEMQQRIPSTVTPTRALGRISPTPGPKAVRFLYAEIADGEIAKSYLQCEIEDRGWNLGKISLNKYLSVGKQILNDLSRLSDR